MSQAGPLSFPPQLFQLDENTSTVQSVIDQLEPLGLQWQVESDPDRKRVRALAPLHINPETGEIWGMTAVENWGSPRHEHNRGGIYGEAVITLVGELNDVTDEGEEVVCVPGTTLFHAGGTTHQATTEGFWAGLYHQPRGSKARPIPGDPDSL